MSAAEKLPELFTEAEAASYLGKSIVTLRRWRRDGKIGSIKIGRGTKFTEAHLREFLESGECPASSTASPTSTPSSPARGRQTSTSNGGSADRLAGLDYPALALSGIPSKPGEFGVTLHITDLPQQG